ncbi:hypothetical protein [Haladaptatus salinisoli]|uniref:hypothetical protein n=1 Tax=Haladaptatus salinisoli TaxID=2884876 RepID=UPI001D09ACA2|nr:hypothetical protein [Haladaptatus salinisoli]
MGQTNQANDSGGGSKWVTNHPMGAAIIAYAFLSIPVYFWLEGPVGTAGTVDGSIVIAGLVLGSIMFVPIIKAVLTNRFGASRVQAGPESE